MLQFYTSNDVDRFAFIASTYATSIMWILFVFAVLLIAQLKRMSEIFVRAFELRLVHELPIAMIVGIPCLLSWPGLFLIKLI